jgi:hypothetical protein
VPKISSPPQRNSKAEAQKPTLFTGYTEYIQDSSSGNYGEKILSILLDALTKSLFRVFARNDVTKQSVFISLCRDMCVPLNT